MRQPKPWFHKQSRNWKVQFGTKQINLGPDKKEAWDKYHSLMAQRGQPTRRSKDPTLYDVLNRFLGFCESNRNTGTFQNTKRHLKRLSSRVGKRLKVADLTTDHIYDWIDTDYKGRSSTYKNDAISAVTAAINHAGLENPIRGIEKPSRQQREFYLIPDQWQLLLDQVSDREFRDYCVFALQSGARPQETRAIEKRHYDKTNCRIVFPREEAKGRKRPRYIYLDDVALEIIERNLRSDGPLLRNTLGNPWNKDNLNCRFRKLKSKLQMPELCAYTLRHSFAVWKLTKGTEVAMVAKLMGHVDSRMVEQRYGHIERNTTVMLRAATQTGSPLDLTLEPSSSA